MVMTEFRLLQSK